MHAKILVVRNLRFRSDRWDVLLAGDRDGSRRGEIGPSAVSWCSLDGHGERSKWHSRASDGRLAAVGIACIDAGNCPTCRAKANILRLENPSIDWVALAQSFGVEAARAEDMGQLNDLLATSFKREGPFVIELAVD